MVSCKFARRFQGPSKVSCKFARRFQGPSKVSCKFVRRQRRRLLVHADWNHARDGVASVIPAGKLLATASILTRIKVYNKRRRRFNLSKRFLTKDGVASILPRGAKLATASQRTFPRGRKMFVVVILRLLPVFDYPPIISFPHGADVPLGEDML